MPTKPTPAPPVEPAGPSRFTSWKPEPRRERFEVRGTPFVLELSEIVDGTRLFELEKQRDARVNSRVLMKQNHGVIVSEAMANCLTWLEAGCTGIFEVGADGSETKIADGITYVEACRGTLVMKDSLVAAGAHVCRLTQGDLEKKEPTTAATKGPTNESSG